MAVRLDTLGDVKWGERLLLARRRANVNLDDAAKLVSKIAPVSYGTLVRLEKMGEPPKDIKRRFIAFLVLLVYGYNPEDFGLSRKDVPPGIDANQLDKVLNQAKGAYIISAGRAA